ncbi:FAD binding domain-containing protein [Microbacterium sediminicola]|uniref:FAD binding domain-containing protein n=1 Tax=Microbacterium sediminicola TaxID=415210 RepID=A0ABP4UEL6_9MICO
MDITSVTSFRRATSRADLSLSPGEVVMAGGTWLMSEPQPDTTGFVDLMGLDWPDLEVSDEGLRISATCTIATLVAWSRGETEVPVPSVWTAAAVIPDAANALLASFKIWNTATVGGNICRSFTAASMVSLTATLDGIGVIWTPDGGERREPIAQFVTGQGTNTLAPGEVMRAIDIPAHALRSRAVIHKVALAELGRSGVVVSARQDEDDSTTFVATAATLTPHVLRYAGIPKADVLAADVAGASDFYSDPLGEADWRQGVSVVLAERCRADLEGAR